MDFMTFFCNFFPLMCHPLPTDRVLRMMIMDPAEHAQKMALVLFPFPYYNVLIGFGPKSVSFSERSLHYDQHHQ
jgi:hypothetical protein